ncbi:hypothetical protein SAMN04487895_107117 [Paenibacillus sophorae]|uniref:Uncharacterized protein n=1 Tax=Paenibacillus sophorae TaxID=1333845 RepID=A0A1H8PAD8_9BACL|nr:hypothetical protein [Paenibacillus sophorae]QWU16501.1 hypothetical protein KP014_04495 [Paenibacillus sophorae]SEO38910.1 hypothetical protein SAMN04487895_107117 [Paenibacillus sophorae]
MFGSLLSGHISKGVEPLSSQLPAGTSENLAAGGIPPGISPQLLTEVKTVFTHAFQNVFSISLVFVIITFFICWFLKKEVLSQKKEDSAETIVEAL